MMKGQFVAHGIGRDGQRTMLTEQTKNAFLIIESVDPERGEVLDAATQKLAELSEKYLGGKEHRYS